MLSHTDEETTEKSSHTNVLDKAVKEVNKIGYQEMKNMVIDQRTKQKILNQSRKRNLKKIFLEKSKQSHKSTFLTRENNFKLLLFDKDLLENIKKTKNISWCKAKWQLTPEIPNSPFSSETDRILISLSL